MTDGARQPVEPAQNPESWEGASGSDDPGRLGLGVPAESAPPPPLPSVGMLFDYKPMFLGGNLIGSRSPDSSVTSAPAHSTHAACVNTSDHLTGLMKSISQRYLMSNSA